MRDFKPTTVYRLVLTIAYLKFPAYIYGPLACGPKGTSGSDESSAIDKLEKGQRHAVEAGDKAKLYSYQKAITNFDSKRSHIFFATTDTCGNIGKDYAKLISLVARIQHPGVGVDGKYDVDGLRSQAVAFARRTVGAGVWRANYMTISLWASRTYGAAAPVGR